MIQYINAFVVTIKGTLKNPYVYIIIVQLGLGIVSYALFIYDEREDRAEAKRKQERIDFLEKENEGKTIMLLNVLIPLNTKTSTLLDSANAELKRMKK